jgi:hypothetical protein
MTRRLLLRAERLGELSPADLASVHGGLPTDMCVTEYPTVPCTVLVTIVTPVVTTITP